MGSLGKRIPWKRGARNAETYEQKLTEALLVSLRLCPLTRNFHPYRREISIRFPASGANRPRRTTSPRDPPLEIFTGRRGVEARTIAR